MITYRHLFKTEHTKYAEYLKSLDRDTLLSFFGYLTKPESIDQLIAKIVSDPSKHEFIVAQDAEFKWIGIIHIAIGKNDAELGIIVRPENRQKGMGNELVSRAKLWCRNRGFLNIYMHCATRNTAIMRLVNKHKLKINRQYDEADAHITLAKPNLMSLWHEHIIAQSDWTKAAYRISLNYGNYCFN